MRKILLLVFMGAALPAWAATDGAPPLAKAVRQALGSVRGDYFVPNRPVSAQILMGLGVPDPVKHIADGNDLLSGCRPHSCDEKASVIVTPAGAMLAAGLIYFRCDPPGASKDCAPGPHLAIFLKRNDDRPTLARELRDWAARKGYTGAAETVRY